MRAIRPILPALTVALGLVCPAIAADQAVRQHDDDKAALRHGDDDAACFLLHEIGVGDTARGPAAAWQSPRGQVVMVRVSPAGDQPRIRLLPDKIFLPHTLADGLVTFTMPATPWTVGGELELWMGSELPPPSR